MNLILFALISVWQSHSWANVDFCSNIFNISEVTHSSADSKTLSQIRTLIQLADKSDDVSAVLAQKIGQFSDWSTFRFADGKTLIDLMIETEDANISAAALIRAGVDLFAKPDGGGPSIFQQIILHPEARQSLVLLKSVLLAHKEVGRVHAPGTRDFIFVDKETGLTRNLLEETYATRSHNFYFNWIVHSALASGNFEIVNYVINHLKYQEFENYDDRPSSDHYLPNYKISFLGIAIENRQFVLARLLMNQHRMSPNVLIVDWAHHRYTTALNFVIQDGTDYWLTESMLEHGANPSLTSSNHMDAMMTAVYVREVKGDVRFVKLFHSHGIPMPSLKFQLIMKAIKVLREAAGS